MTHFKSAVRSKKSPTEEINSFYPPKRWLIIPHPKLDSSTSLYASPSLSGRKKGEGGDIIPHPKLTYMYMPVVTGIWIPHQMRSVKATRVPYQLEEEEESLSEASDKWKCYTTLCGFGMKLFSLVGSNSGNPLHPLLLFGCNNKKYLQLHSPQSIDRRRNLAAHNWSGREDLQIGWWGKKKNWGQFFSPKSLLI